MFRLLCLYVWALTWDDRRIKNTANFLARADNFAAYRKGYFDRHPKRRAFTRFMSPLFRWNTKVYYILRDKIRGR